MNINIWRSNFCLPGLCETKYQITIFLSEAYLPAQRLFCQFFHVPFVLLVLLCYGTQMFPKKYMQVWVPVYSYASGGFVVNCLNSINSIFEEFGDGVAFLIRQSLDQCHSGNRVLGKQAPSALFHMIPSEPSKRYLTYLDSVENIYWQHQGNLSNDFFCSILSLQMHQPGEPQTAKDLGILPSGGQVAKINASVLNAMAVTPPGLKHKASLPCTAFNCICFLLTWCSPKIFWCLYCVAVTVRKQVCLRHWIKHLFWTGFMWF